MRWYWSLCCSCSRYPRTPPLHQRFCASVHDGCGVYVEVRYGGYVLLNNHLLALLRLVVCSNALVALALALAWPAADLSGYSQGCATPEEQDHRRKIRTT